MMVWNGRRWDGKRAVQIRKVEVKRTTGMQKSRALMTQGSPEQEKDSPSERSAVDAGMSGSGVFDRKGELLGILAGGDGERGFAAVPVWRIGE